MVTGVGGSELGLCRVGFGLHLAAPGGVFPVRRAHCNKAASPFPGLGSEPLQAWKLGPGWGMISPSWKGAGDCLMDARRLGELQEAGWALWQALELGVPGGRSGMTCRSRKGKKCWVGVEPLGLGGHRRWLVQPMKGPEQTLGVVLARPTAHPCLEPPAARGSENACGSL